MKHLIVILFANSLNVCFFLVMLLQVEKCSDVIVEVYKNHSFITHSFLFVLILSSCCSFHRETGAGGGYLRQPVRREGFRVLRGFSRDQP